MLSDIVKEKRKENCVQMLRSIYACCAPPPMCFCLAVDVSASLHF